MNPRKNNEEEKENKLLPTTLNNEVTLTGRYDLQVGQWVKFSTSKNITTLSKVQQDIYQDNRIFLVLTRADRLFDSCRCYLIDENGKTYNYCPRLNSLGYEDLLWTDSKIFIIPAEKIKIFYGEERLKLIYEEAQKHFEKMNDFYKKYPPVIKIDIQSLLNPSKIGPSKAYKSSF